MDDIEYDHESLKKYLKGILVLVLIISVGLSLYDHFVWIPQIVAQGQARENNLRVQAFNLWLNKMTLIHTLLLEAQTYIDLNEIEVHTSWAMGIFDIVDTGIHEVYSNQDLYYEMGQAIAYLDRAVDKSYMNKNFDQNMISNVTSNMAQLAYMDELSLNGVDPAQQLRDAGVLDSVLNHLEQIYQISLNFLVVNHY